MNNSTASWRVVVHPKAADYLTRIPGKDTQRIRAALGELAESPFGGDTRKMKGEPSARRRRVGPYRILFEIVQPQRMVFVFDIKRRTSATY